MYHHIKINESSMFPGRTKVYVEDKQLNGVTELTYHNSVDEVPYIEISVIPEKCDVDVYAAVGLKYVPRDVKEAVRCIQLEMRLDDDFKDAVRASVLSALSEIDLTKDNLSKAADMIIDRIFFGER